MSGATYLFSVFFVLNQSIDYIVKPFPLIGFARSEMSHKIWRIKERKEKVGEWETSESLLKKLENMSIVYLIFECCLKLCKSKYYGIKFWSFLIEYFTSFFQDKFYYQGMFKSYCSVFRSGRWTAFNEGWTNFERKGDSVDQSAMVYSNGKAFQYNTVDPGTLSIDACGKKLAHFS